MQFSQEEKFQQTTVPKSGKGGREIGRVPRLRLLIPERTFLEHLLGAPVALAWLHFILTTTPRSGPYHSFRRHAEGGAHTYSRLRGDWHLPHWGCAVHSPLPPQVLAAWDCRSFPPPHNLRLASHLLLRDALKTDESVFSQSSQGLLGPYQGSVLLAKAQ